MTNNNTKIMIKMMLEKLKQEDILPSFEYPEKGFNKAFDKIHIPWYLAPFRAKIKGICISYINNKRYIDSDERIKIKRPNQY